MSNYQNDRMKRKLGILPPLPTRKEKKKINPISPKRAAQIKEEKEQRGDNDTELQKWFKNRIKQMTGYCAETGLKTETRIYRYAIMSICHLLPKSTCPSVALSPSNWIELNCDFHFKFDAMSWEEREKLGCWPIIRDRLVMVYCDLSLEDLRHFPESVLNYMKIKYPDPTETT